MHQLFSSTTSPSASGHASEAGSLGSGGHVAMWGPFPLDDGRSSSPTTPVRDDVDTQHVRRQSRTRLIVMRHPVPLHPSFFPPLPPFFFSSHTTMIGDDDLSKKSGCGNGFWFGPSFGYVVQVSGPASCLDAGRRRWYRYLRVRPRGSFLQRVQTRPKTSLLSYDD